MLRALKGANNQKSKRTASTSKQQKDAAQCKGRILSDSVQYIRYVFGMSANIVLIFQRSTDCYVAAIVSNQVSRELAHFQWPIRIIWRPRQFPGCLHFGHAGGNGCKP